MQRLLELISCHVSVLSHTAFCIGPSVFQCFLLTNLLACTYLLTYLRTYLHSNLLGLLTTCLFACLQNVSKVISVLIKIAVQKVFVPGLEKLWK